MINKAHVDKERVIEILTQAFESNKSVNYIVKQDRLKKERIRCLMEYSVAICELFGKVYLTDDKNACALILYPETQKTTLQTLFLDIKLIFKCIGVTGIGKTLARENKIKNLRPKVKMAYLWFIGTTPEMQHTGIGSKLMKQIIYSSEKDNLPVFLETSTVANLTWYKSLGFHIYNQLDLSYTLHFLSR